MGSSSIQWIRAHYDVPAKVRGRVEYTFTSNEGSIPEGTKRLGTITGARGPYLLIRLDGNLFSRPFHPTWHIRYLEPPGRALESTEQEGGERP